MLRLAKTEMLDLSVIPLSAPSLDSGDSPLLGGKGVKLPFLQPAIV